MPGEQGQIFLPPFWAARQLSPVPAKGAYSASDRALTSD